jgi:hypothetical protein
MVEAERQGRITDPPMVRRALADAKEQYASTPNIQNRLMLANVWLKAGDAKTAAFHYTSVLTDAEAHNDAALAATAAAGASLAMYYDRRYNDARLLAEQGLRHVSTSTEAQSSRDAKELELLQRASMEKLEKEGLLGMGLAVTAASVGLLAGLLVLRTVRGKR